LVAARPYLARKVDLGHAALRELPEDERQRYHGLDTLAREIRENYKGLDASSRVLLDELVQKLDFLMAFYLRMRYSLARYDGYLATTDPDHEAASFLDVALRLDDGIVRALSRPKPVTVLREARVESRLQDLQKGLLDESVEHRRDAKLAHLSVALWNELSSYR